MKHSELKRTKGINKFSRKRKAIMPEEARVKSLIYSLGNGMCELCGKEKISDRGHEIVFRSQGGGPTNPFNIIMLCQRCHDFQHGKIRGFPPHSKEYLLGFIKSKRELQGFKEE